ncbi:MAG: hypothetical protein ACT4OI_02870 [Methanobacteriota archaeon]
MLDTARTTVLLISVAILSGGAALTVGLFTAPGPAGDGSDMGLDTNGNGRYEWLLVTASVDLPEAGLWDVSATLLSPTMPTGGPCATASYPRPEPLLPWPGIGTFETPPEPAWPIAYVYERYFFEPGSQSVRLAFAGTDIFRAGVDGSFRVEATLSLGGGVVYYDNGILPGPLPPSVSWSYVTGLYRAADFEEPFRPVSFTGVFADEALHVDDDGLYDLFEIRAGVRVTTPGAYTLNGALMERADPTNEYGFRSVAYAYRDVRLDTGDTNVTLRFRGDAIRAAAIDGPWDFQITLYPGAVIYGDGSMNRTFETSSHPVVMFPEMLCGTTSAWAAAGFDDTPELLRYTGLFEESTVDYDGDLRYEALVVRAEVEVFVAAGFDLRGSLLSEDGTAYIGTFDAQAWLPVGVAWTDWAFSGTDIFASGVDGPYVARLSITPAAGGIDPETTYLTKAYRHTEFEDAASNRTSYWIESLRVAAIDASGVEVVVDVRRGEDFLTYVIEDLLTTSVVDAAGVEVFRAVDRVYLPSGGSWQSFAYRIERLGPGTYTIVAILGPEDGPVDRRAISMTL